MQLATRITLASSLCGLACGKIALLVVGSISNDVPGASDVYFKEELESAGYAVTLVDDDTVEESGYLAPTTYDLVVVSASISSSKVGGKFKDVPSDFLSWEEGVYDEMGMVSAAAGDKKLLDNGAASTYWKLAKPDNDYPYTDDRTSITFGNSSSACSLAAGLSGSVAVYSQPYSMSWGRPASGATVIATIETPSYNGEPKAVIFSYGKGDTLADGTVAKGKRVAFFPYHFSTGNSNNGTLMASDPADGSVPFTSAGRTLVKAAISMDLECANTVSGTPKLARLSYGLLLHLVFVLKFAS